MSKRSNPITTERTTRMTTRMTTKKTTPRYLRLHNEVWQKVEKYAHQENRPLSNMLEQIVMEWIALREKEDVKEQIKRSVDKLRGDD